MAFRDTFDKCPRCGVTLEDAQSARGCRGCNGVFVEEPVLAEMLIQMLPPLEQFVGRLDLTEVKRTGGVLACPTCSEPMTPTTIHLVELDHCAKHGVWFDPDELQVTLYRVSDPKNPPPFKPFVFQPSLPSHAPPFAAPPIPEVKPERFEWEAAPKPYTRLTLQKIAPNGEISEHRFSSGTVVKIGKLKSCAIRVDDDPNCSRIHAVIEVEVAACILIDLGSVGGTLVNGTKVTKQKLALEDIIRVGDTQLRVVTPESLT